MVNIFKNNSKKKSNSNKKEKENELISEIYNSEPESAAESAERVKSILTKGNITLDINKKMLMKEKEE